MVEKKQWTRKGVAHTILTELRGDPNKILTQGDIEIMFESLDISHAELVNIAFVMQCAGLIHRKFVPEAETYIYQYLPPDERDQGHRTANQGHVPIGTYKARRCEIINHLQDALSLTYHTLCGVDGNSGQARIGYARLWDAIDKALSSCHDLHTIEQIDGCDLDVEALRF